jgi:hypothetical protein
MRVSLAVDGTDRVWGIWLDKRNAKSGYAVWGAASNDGGRTFGTNQLVQDALGDAVAQWHASIAGGKPGFVAAWDDTREEWGNPDEPGDVLVSWNSGAGWSADLLVPGASGDGYQGSPAVTIDPRGDLHLVWIEREGLSSPTRLRYMRGVFGMVLEDGAGVITADVTLPNDPAPSEPIHERFWLPEQMRQLGRTPGIAGSRGQMTATGR